MPRDRNRTADCQGEAEEESENEVWMRELQDTPLDRFPGIALGIYATGCPSFGQFFRWISAECCRRQHSYPGDNRESGNDGQRASETAITARTTRRHWLWVPYQNQLLSRPGCSVGVGLPGLYGQGFSRRMLTARIRIYPGRKGVLACRQVAIVISAFGEASHVLAIDRDDKAQIGSKVCDPINDHMT
jgi:hypothetical protein